CGEQWRKEHPAPDVATWREIRGLKARARHGLRELYGWYRDHGDELMPLYRDLDSSPQRHVRRHWMSSNGSPTR
ncbi:MAG: hypothetical protein M3O70_20285, partial [Actinomycetota bacterium]|nr:hypothetical protein [Actinomycetota bacterium]